MKSSILVVDDDLLLLKRVESILEEMYTVYLAKTASAALKLLETRTPDCILLDIDMPFMSGYEMIRKIKGMENLCMIPVIFLTGMDGTTDELMGLELGAVDYIRKPFHNEVFLARIRVHILNAGLRKDGVIIDPVKLKRVSQKLTGTELRVAKLLALGWQYNEIAEDMNYSGQYVRKMGCRIFEKLEVEKREDLKKILT